MLISGMQHRDGPAVHSLTPDAVRASVDVIPHILIHLDDRGVILMANAFAARVFEDHDLAGRNWLDDCVAKEDRAAEERILRGGLTGGSLPDEPRRVRITTRSSAVRVLMIKTAIVRTKDGVVTGLVSSADDITDPEPAQSVVRETLAALEAYRFALDASAIVAITDRRGVIRHVNEQFCATSKYAPDELLGKDHRILNSGYHSRDFFKAMWAQIGRGQVWQGDIRNRAKDGSIYWVATTIVPFLDDEGRPKQYVAIRFEITERKLAETALERTVRDLAVAREEEARRAEALSEAHDRLQAAHRRIKEEQAKLIQAEKLSSIGILASGVAHEINNPLAGVMNCVKALSEDTVRQTRRGEYFRTAQDGLERIQQIVRGLLDYARQRPLTPTTCDVEEILAACQRLIAPYLRKNNVELELRLPATQVKGDRSQLMQALINILLNAVYVSEPNQAVIVSVQKAPGQIGITVRDFGPGMPEDVAQRACDPFFTTKPEGEGTGLGLAVTASIVRAHGGELEFQVHGRNDDAEAGTSATIWLPEVGAQGAHHA
ncbi:MAG: PAS domain S-box protein [Myxococcota bacterium]